ncbi:hypothetical protein [Paractinoplanes lichenicola]|uniref:Uncharacterized protein n=1 Tax=Paractinoplanes lichenicola TaxID=2802976 RepID=A0ABS1VU63_9ACTN|nr:hypothetical protein [Actinoplanes lichenicola]MBL7258014.1 hypothetical protein [Actinoplanes lichenicola]
MGTFIVILLIILVLAILGKALTRPKKPTFEVISRTDKPPVHPAPKQPLPPFGQGDGAVEFSAQTANAKARCYLTGMEVGSCTCKKHSQ